MPHRNKCGTPPIATITFHSRGFHERRRHRRTDSEESEIHAVRQHAQQVLDHHDHHDDGRVFRLHPADRLQQAVSRQQDRRRRRDLGRHPAGHRRARLHHHHHRDLRPPREHRVRCHQG